MKTIQTKTDAPALQGPYSDEELINDFLGFSNHNTRVNGVQLHYVDGGNGPVLICLPGWPQTWYSYHPIAAALAKSFRVIVVDIRGMGSSEKPQTGYDKKTMAADIAGLVRHLGLTKVNIMGHDIGGMVAMSFAYNYPELTEKLIVLDGLHPNEGMLQMPLMPVAGTFTEKMNPQAPYAWWMGFNQVKGLPEQLLQGRFRLLLDWLFNYVMIDDSKMTPFEREVYASVYNEPEAIRASNAWYQAFGQDVEDSKGYAPLTMPVLGIGSNVSYGYMKMGIGYAATNATVIGMVNSGHYLYEEEPRKVIDAVVKFLSIKHD